MSALAKNGKTNAFKLLMSKFGVQSTFITFENTGEEWTVPGELS